MTRDERNMALAAEQLRMEVAALAGIVVGCCGIMLAAQCGWRLIA
ncbi:MAG TPA: hypothetical protein PKM88_16605 [bacterium]|nr:hypothetical protein [bacterium]